MRKVLYMMGILEDTDIEWMAEKGLLQQVAPGAVLIQEGQPIDQMYLLLDGMLTVSTGGRQVASLSPGEVVGEISFVDARLPMASVTAARSSRVLAIPLFLLREKLRSDSWFASRLYQALATFLADRLRTTTSRLGYGNALDDELNADADELNGDMMDGAALAAVRFDKLQKKLRARPAVDVAGVRG